MDSNAQCMGVGETRVLVVDDYRDCADALVEMLCFFGFDAHACYSTEAALAAASSLKPRVVVMEPTMPGPELDGYQLAGLLRQGTSPGELLLAAFSTAGQSRDRNRMEQAGFDAFILKPDTAQSILRLVRERQRQL